MALHTAHSSLRLELALPCRQLARGLRYEETHDDINRQYSGCALQYSILLLIIVVFIAPADARLEVHITGIRWLTRTRLRMELTSFCPWFIIAKDP